MSKGRVLITGSNSEIGLAAAQVFDRDGARVAVKLDHVTRTFYESLLLVKSNRLRIRSLCRCPILLSEHQAEALSPNGSLRGGEDCPIYERANSPGWVRARPHQHGQHTVSSCRPLAVLGRHRQRLHLVM